MSAKLFKLALDTQYPHITYDISQRSFNKSPTRIRNTMTIRNFDSKEELIQFLNLFVKVHDIKLHRYAEAYLIRVNVGQFIWEEYS